MENKEVFSAVVKNDDERVLNPYEYFQSVKDKIQTMDNEKLTTIYNNAVHLAETYKKTGQKKGLQKLVFHIESIMKEKQVLDAGITKFVYRDDIEEYIQNVADKQVVILDIASYERSIPDEVVEAMMKVKDLFDEFYIVCTDYNGKMAKQVEKERREKDPILFGVFLDRGRSAINERFYYIGDWVDEYCDLTLDKMVAEMKDNINKDIIHNIDIPEDKEALQKQLDSLQLLQEDVDDEYKQITLLSKDDDLGKGNKQKKGMFSKIKTFLGGKND